MIFRFDYLCSLKRFLFAKSRVKLKYKNSRIVTELNPHPFTVFCKSLKNLPFSFLFPIVPVLLFVIYPCKERKRERERATETRSIQQPLKSITHARFQCSTLDNPFSPGYLLSVEFQFS